MLLLCSNEVNDGFALVPGTASAQRRGPHHRYDAPGCPSPQIHTLRTMTVEVFFAKYRPPHLAKAPKHVVLREALIAAIQDGHWKEGERLPTEQELTRLTPYSLGTVQRAVRTLVAEGFVTRKPRLGTVVTGAERRIGGPWIFRFLNADGSGFAAMSTRVVGRRRVSGKAPWRPWLTMGDESRALLAIDRVIHVDGVAVFSRFFVDPERFPVIATTPVRELHGANFVGLLQSTYRLPVSHAARTVQCMRLPDPACKAMNAPAGSYGLVVEIAGSAGLSRPVFYQQLFIPHDAARLFISDSFPRWVTAAELLAAPPAPRRRSRTAPPAEARTAVGGASGG